MTKYQIGEWYGWNGGDNPVPGEKVLIVLRNAETIYFNVPTRSEHLDWSHEGDEEDIVAFQIEKGYLH